jgi:hypothetical protein
MDINKRDPGASRYQENEVYRLHLGHPTIEKFSIQNLRVKWHFCGVSLDSCCRQSKNQICKSLYLFNRWVDFHHSFHITIKPWILDMVVSIDFGKRVENWMISSSEAPSSMWWCVVELARAWPFWSFRSIQKCRFYNYMPIRVIKDDKYFGETSGSAFGTGAPLCCRDFSAWVCWRVVFNSLQAVTLSKPKYV